MYPWQLHRSKRYIYLLHGFVSVWDDAGKGNDVVLEVQTPNQESIMQKKSACAFAFKNTSSYDNFAVVLSVRHDCLMIWMIWMNSHSQSRQHERGPPEMPTAGFAPPSSLSSTVATAAIAATAVVACVVHVRATRRLRQHLTEQRLAERKGRIRAEVQLRSLMKQRSVNAEGGGVTKSDGEGDDGANSVLQLKQIGTVVSPFTKRMGTPRQGALAPNARGYVQLSAPVETVEGMDMYSHAWIIFTFHANTDRPDSTKTKIRPPRAPKGTKVGMLATRSPHRPNNIGLSLVKVVSVNRKEKQLHIAALDLVNGTPVYDVKPCVPWDIPGFHDANSLSVPRWVSQDDALKKVVVTPVARSALENLVRGKTLAPLYTLKNDGVDGAEQTLKEILAQDPRAANTRGSKRGSHDDPYRIVFCSAVVEFVVDQNGVTVVDVKPGENDIAGAVHVDGIPLLGV